MASSDAGDVSRCNQLGRLLKEARAEKKAAIRDLEERYQALRTVSKKVDKLTKDYLKALENLVNAQGLCSVSREPTAVEEKEKCPTLSPVGAGAGTTQEGESSTTGKNRQRSSAIQRIRAALSPSDDRARGRPPPTEIHSSSSHSRGPTTSQGSSTPANGPGNTRFPGRILNPTREELMRYHQSSPKPPLDSSFRSLARTRTSSDSPSFPPPEPQSRQGNGRFPTPAAPNVAQSPVVLIPPTHLTRSHGNDRAVGTTGNTLSNRVHQRMDLHGVGQRSHNLTPPTSIPRPLETQDDHRSIEDGGGMKRGSSSSHEDHRAKLQKRGGYSH